LKKKFDTVVWVNEYSNCTGEGILAQQFLKNYFENNKNDIVKVITFNKEFILNKDFKNINIKNMNNFFYNYFSFFFGIFYLWQHKNKKIIYLNYLPLWNFLIFFLLPKKTILGPVTGGVKINNYNSLANIFRKLFFNFFYKISLFIIFIKFKKIIFSTNLLKNNIIKKNNFLFGYVYNLFHTKKILNKKKKFDIIFYNRNYLSKEGNLIKNIILNLPDKIKICIIGDKLLKKNVKNYGYVSRQKAKHLISSSKFAFASGENILSIFAIDSYNSGAKLFYNQPTLNDNFIDKKNSKPIFFNHEEKSIKIISESLAAYSKFSNNLKFRKTLLEKQKDINLFLKNYF
jgi:hypothetical protein